MHKNAVSGTTLRFTFNDGPMAGKTFEHVFEKDGSVRFRQTDTKGAEGEGTMVKKYESATIGTDVTAISYLGASGYTLTAVLDWRTKTLVAFSSNDKMHLMQHGTFEPADASQTDPRKESGVHVAPHR
jgi:hypothetical protein